MNILITAASSGFGQLMVKDLLGAGHRVVGSMRDVAGRNAETAQALKALGADVVEIDVTDDESVLAGVAAAEKTLGKIDILINNAGVGAYGLQENFSADDFKRLFDINVFGVQRMIRAVVPGMRARGEGLVMNISSLLGRVAMPFYGPYNATKWAIEAVTENYRAELSAFGVEFVLVEPSGFPTGFIDNLMRPTSKDRDEGYGAMAEVPEASLAAFEAMLEENPQQNPQIVSDAVLSVIAQARGSRPFRTVVDRLGMAAPLEEYNEHLAQLTNGFFSNMGIESMLSVRQ
ncbi:MAG: SDR family oxidoreductase [Pseudomonadota bacterium]